MSLAICSWVQPSKNRSSRIRRSRGASFADGRAEHDASLGAAELQVLVGHQVAEGGGAVLPHRHVERGRRERTVGGERLDDGLDVEADVLGDLAGPRGAAELLGELAGDLRDLALQLLDPARRADRPAEVAEVALDLTGDGGHRVGQEVPLVAGVETVHGLDQPDVGRLDQVVLGQAALAVAVRDRPGHTHVEHHDLGAQRGLLVLVVGVVQLIEEPGGGRATVRLGIGLSDGAGARGAANLGGDRHCRLLPVSGVVAAALPPGPSAEGFPHRRRFNHELAQNFR